MASVTPVVDGFVLRKGELSLAGIQKLGSFSQGLVYSSLPRLVRANARHVLTASTSNRQGIALLPHQMIESKAVSSLPGYSNQR
jgi:actin-like protein 6A